MNRSDYLALRTRVESEVFEALKDSAAAAVLLNSIMCHFVQAEATYQVRRNVDRLEFLTFRRDPDLKAPSWAFRKPGEPRVFPTIR